MNTPREGRSHFSLFAVRQLVPRLRPHRPALSIAAVALVISAAIGLAFPLIVRHLMDAAFENRDASALNSIAILLLVIFAAQAVFNFVQVYLLSATAEKVVAGLRTQLFAHLLTLSPGFYAERSSGELTSRLASDCSTLQIVLSHQMAEFLRQILYLVGALTLLAILHTDLMVTTITVAPIVVLSAYGFGSILRVKSTQVQDQLARSNAAAEEAFTQIPIVQSFTREGWEEQRYGSRIASALRIAIQRALVRGLFFGMITFIAFGGIVVVLWKGGLLVLEGQITAGELVSFLLYAVSVAAAITALASLYSGYQEAMGAAQRVFELLETDPAIKEPRHSEALPPASDPGGLVFQDVWFRYGPDEPWVLQSLDLEIRPGEIVALVGSSGAGKSTLAALVPRFWDPTQGVITLRGADLRRLPLIELRTAVGIVPQEPLLFADIPQATRDTDPGRSHEQSRHGKRGTRGGSASDGDGGADDVDHRTPAEDSSTGRPGARDRRWENSRGGHARGSGGRGRDVRPPVPRSAPRPRRELYYLSYRSAGSAVSGPGGRTISAPMSRSRVREV